MGEVSKTYSLEKTNQLLASLAGTSDTTPSIYNVPCASSATEYNQALPANTKSFMLKARGNSKITFSYSTGASDTLTIEVGNSFFDNNFYSLQTIYFTCSKDNETVEIVAYV